MTNKANTIELAEIELGLKVMFHGDQEPAALRNWVFQIDCADIKMEKATGRIIVQVFIVIKGKKHTRRTYADQLRTVDGRALVI